MPLSKNVNREYQKQWQRLKRSGVENPGEHIDMKKIRQRVEPEASNKSLNIEDIEKIETVGEILALILTTIKEVRDKTRDVTNARCLGYLSKIAGELLEKTQIDKLQKRVEELETLLEKGQERQVS